MEGRNAFVHLHNHTREGSLLDGLSSVKGLAQRAKALGQPAIAITDHGAMYGVIDFYRACKDVGVKPVIGCEVYVAPNGRTRFDKVHGIDNESRHLVLLCKNEIGYQNLSYIVSKGFVEGFYVKPRVDMELLEQYHEGLIALSACLGGEIPKQILKGDYKAARDYAVKLRDIFGNDSFYLELQDHGIREQAIVNGTLLRIHDETGIPLVCTNDTHYLAKEDAESHDVLLCIQTGKVLTDEKRMKMEPHNFYVRSTEKMADLFGRYPDALSNTVKIADMCNVDFTFGTYHAPEFDVPAGHTAQSFIRELCDKGFWARYGDPKIKTTEYAQLDFELKMIEKMGFTDYFLIVSDIVQYAKGQGIPVGPGRGSAAGSIVSYCLYITDLDPLKYSLYFERFLNPERVSMPDIDMDFCSIRRGEVIEYVKQKYGEDRVAQIITFGTMAAKGAIRDVGRVLGMPFADVAAVTKQIPNAVHITIDDAMTQNPVLKDMYKSDPAIRRLIDIAKTLEGVPRNSSTHAAGVVITKNPVHTYVPLARNEDTIVCQYNMVTLEQLGLLKLDFLALRNLSVLDDAMKMIRRHTPDFSMSWIDDQDAGVYEMLGAGKTCGVFQMESVGMTGVCTSLKPQSIEDLTAIVALYRPGPMDSIPQFVNNKHHPEQIVYKHPMLEPVLSISYGIIVYQEQVIEVFRRLAGYSLGQADMVRRAMSKKKVADIEKERGAFIHGDPERNIKGCLANGIAESVAQSLYDEIYAFANYAFNKAHAVCYADVAFQTAWFKYHYPSEYMAALLTSVLDSTEKVSAYIAECKNMGLELRNPDVNRSEDSFTVEDGNAIRFGLVAIKSIGRSVIHALVEERTANGPFESFQDFCERMYDHDLNKRAIENLIYAGACDGFGAARSQMLSVLETLMAAIAKDRKRSIEGQIDLFSMLAPETQTQMTQIVFPQIAELDKQELMQKEREVTGLYLSGHPMQEYREEVRRMGAVSLGAIADDYAQENGPSIFYDERMLSVAGIVSAVKTKATKNNTMMAYISLEDDTGTIELICFSRALEKYGSLLAEGTPVLILGKVSCRDEKAPQIIVDKVVHIVKRRTWDDDPEDAQIGQKSHLHDVLPVQTGNQPHCEEHAQIAGKRELTAIPGSVLWIRLPSPKSNAFEFLKQQLSQYPGNVPVKVLFADTGTRAGGVCCFLCEELLCVLRSAFGNTNVAIR